MSENKKMLMMAGLGACLGTMAGYVLVQNYAFAQKARKVLPLAFASMLPRFSFHFFCLVVGVLKIKLE